MGRVGTCISMTTGKSCTMSLKRRCFSSNVVQSLAYNFGCRALYNLLCWASVSIHQVRCNIPTLRPYCEKIYTTFLNDAEILTTYFCVLWCSHIIHIHPYSLSTTTAFDLVTECSDIAVFVWLRVCAGHDTGTGIDVRRLVGLSAHCATHLLSDEPMRCCAAGTDGCLDLRRRDLHLMDRWAPSGAEVQAPWHVVLETVWLICDEPQQVGCLQELEACLLVSDAGIQSQFARHHWWQGQRGGCEHCSTRQVECTGAKVAVCNIVALAPQPEQASRLRSANHDASLLCRDLRC